MSTWAFGLPQPVPGSQPGQARNLPGILNSREYQVPTVFISPSTPDGTTSESFYDHYSLLATTEQLLGLPRLRSASSATTMTAAFHL